MGEPEVVTTTTSSRSTGGSSRSKSRTDMQPDVAAAQEAPTTRLASPRLLADAQRSGGMSGMSGMSAMSGSAMPAMPAMPATTTKVVTRSRTPTTSRGVLDRLLSLGYKPLIELVSEGRLDAVYSASPNGEKVLIRTSSRPHHTRSAISFTVEPADDPVVPAEVGAFFLEELVTEVPLGMRVDTDFAVISADGLSVWIKDGTETLHWLYAAESVQPIGEITGLKAGWFVVASVDVDALQEVSAAGKTIVDTLYDPPMRGGVPVATFNVLIQLLKMTGLLQVLRTGGPFTLLAPTDAAFAKLSEGEAKDLVRYQSRDRLAGILEYHVYPARISAENVGSDLPTLTGETIVWDKTVQPVQANSANVLYVDLGASNGIIHILDGVLMPKGMRGGGSRSSRGIKAILSPVDADDVDYTTQRVRQALARYTDRADAMLDSARDKLSSAIAETQRARTRVSSDQKSALSKTKRFNAISEDPTRTKQATQLVGEISVLNDAVDRNLIRENQVQRLAVKAERLAVAFRELAAAIIADSEAAKRT
jgi:uncharacterized surface protein with fasciclin (FAS1) repeats